MCGIAGLTGEGSGEDLSEMLDRMSHRGPDDRGVYADEDLSMGATRLSIVGGESGSQPIFSEDGKVIAVFNGEIYNHRDLRSRLEEKGHSFTTESDTEVLVHGYEEWGRELVERIEGMFSFAIKDLESERLFLARDRFGKKPLYYSHRDGKLLFASEAKALVAHHEIEPAVDTKALAYYLDWGYVAGRRTMFQDVSRLNPGERLIYESGEMEIESFWKFRHSTNQNMSFQTAVERLKSALLESVEKRIPPGETPTVSLSGGIDSSLLVGILDDLGQQVNTITAGIGEEYNEQSKASEVASHFGTDHTEFHVSSDSLDILPEAVYHFDTPVADPAAIPAYMVYRRVTGKTVLTGTGGDELFGGYEHYRIMQLGERYLKPVPGPGRRLLAWTAGKTPRSIMDIGFPYASDLGEAGVDRFQRYLSEIDDPREAYRAIVTRFDSGELERLLQKETLSREDIDLRSGDLMDALMEFETRTKLPEQLLMKGDKMSMAHSVEARTPILGEKVARTASQIPSRFKVGQTSKKVLRHASREFLPRHIRKRSKQRMFVPTHKWLQERSDIRKKVLSIDEPYLDDAEVKRLLDKFEDSPLYRARQVWPIMSYKLWYQTFIQDGSISGPVDI